jgi:hypothetical protein
LIVLTRQQQFGQYEKPIQPFEVSIGAECDPSYCLRKDVTRRRGVPEVRQGCQVDRQFNRRFLQLMSHDLIEPTACTPAADWEIRR